jgi:ABC-type lipoprotein release transport system permease subunit
MAIMKNNIVIVFITNKDSQNPPNFPIFVAMNLPFFIARRYLFAKKSHNVINIISAISAIGMAIGTAALIIILSIYNGFDELVKSTLSNVEPDILVSPAKGKVFIPDSTVLEELWKEPAISTISEVLQENVFIDYEGHQSVAKAKGVDREYEASSTLAGSMVQGTFSLHKGDIMQMAVGLGVANRLGVNTNFLSKAEIFFPKRDKKISLVNPMASINSVRIRPTGIFTVNQSVDDELVIMPIEAMRQLLGYDKEISSLEIRLENSSEKAVRKEIRNIRKILGDEFSIKDRFQQNTSLYKMMRYEKTAIFLILIFIIIIIAFNVFGSLTMLIIEKKDDIETFRSLGATDKLIRNIFTLEGWLISLLGLAAGLVMGIAFALLQQKFGFIKMPGNFMVNSYPVILQWGDILATIIGVALIGYLIALLPVKRNIRPSA